ncbi:hypothetical protein C8J56DRAFT_1044259 [Mycena floridula]|nr:hypothetical protein C8J56DRAFT_1044259 [Mycena floridula]
MAAGHSSRGQYQDASDDEDRPAWVDDKGKLHLLNEMYVYLSTVIHVESVNNHSRRKIPARNRVISDDEESESEEEELPPDSSEETEADEGEDETPANVVTPDHTSVPVIKKTRPKPVDPVDQLDASFQPLKLNNTFGRFLRRNLRMGFENKCREKGINTVSDPLPPNITVVYRGVKGRALPIQLRYWCCPLCDLHGLFKCKDMLEKHLEWDHANITIQWIPIKLPDTWSLNCIATEHQTTEVKPEPNDEALALLPPQELDEPPSTDPLGPAAKFPYLPAYPFVPGSGPSVMRSFRPGGPRLFDLLGTLPIWPYGTQAWMVLEKEEEIFQDNDIKDEHKVMHALWARWMFLNRNYFIADYFRGLQAFLNEYWRMIHQAAGWKALRHFLLVMLVNRYIVSPEVARLLVHYDDLKKTNA